MADKADKADAVEKGGVKTSGSDDVPPVYSEPQGGYSEVHEEQLGIWTRMGFTPKSFQRRTKADFYTAVWPLGGGVNDAEGFFKSYLALFVVIFFWICGYFWKKTGWLKLSQIDVDSGRREVDWDPVMAERARVAAMPKWRRALNVVI
ncbi:putative amino-acid permease inda1 protein [Lasiodiplodia theobromae]|uniref:Amino-acid permease inda1 protein n=1 Tax=Lasiodiplodia theobromae TaxID=45133 RepID=A0A8H7MAG4_9PEZI|nr:putative amino-acid permease inda1 protein [Lasiodiplodia theobromae]